MMDDYRRLRAARRALLTASLSQSSSGIGMAADGLSGDLIAGGGDVTCAVEEIIAQNYSCAAQNILAHVDAHKDSTASR